MSNIYLMIFEPSGVSRDQLIAFMEGSEKVVDYHTSLPQNLFVVVSALSAEDLASIFKGMGGLGNYMFSRIDPQRLGIDTFGWMSKTLWDFIARHTQPTPAAPVIPTPVPTPQSASIAQVAETHPS